VELEQGCVLDEDLFIALEKVEEMDILNSLSGDCSTCRPGQVEALFQHVFVHPLELKLRQNLILRNLLGDQIGNSTKRIG